MRLELRSEVGESRDLVNIERDGEEFSFTECVADFLRNVREVHCDPGDWPAVPAPSVG